MLTEVQEQKLKTNMIEFIEELIEIIKDKELRLKIALETYFNEYGGLVLDITNNSIGYTTNKTNYVRSYSKWDDDCMYKRLKDNKNVYEVDVMLDILKNKELIKEVINKEINRRDNLINEILGG